LPSTCPGFFSAAGVFLRCGHASANAAVATERRRNNLNLLEGMELSGVSFREKSYDKNTCNVLIGEYYTHPI
jgi:hypothetical protein